MPFHFRFPFLSASHYITFVAFLRGIQKAHRIKKYRLCSLLSVVITKQDLPHTHIAPPHNLLRTKTLVHRTTTYMTNSKFQVPLETGLVNLQYCMSKNIWHSCLIIHIIDQIPRNLRWSKLRVLAKCMHATPIKKLWKKFILPTIKLI